MYEPQANSITQLKSIRQKQIFNRLNALHYQGIPLIACLQHKNHERCIYLKAHPEPVANEKVTATWIQNEIFPPNLSSFDLVKIVLSSNRGSYEFSPVTYHLGEKNLLFTVPESAVEASYRKHQRFACEAKNIPIALTQNAIVYKGRLLDFSANGILVNLVRDGKHSLSWLNHNYSAMLSIACEHEPVYTGQVNLSPHGNEQYLLFPNLESTPRYEAREYRSRRQLLTPSPDLVFDHPITGRKLTLKLWDLSSLGFSVEEEVSRRVLIPGLLIKQANISLAGSIIASCMAQVVYSRVDETKPTTVHVGFAILNIDIQDHLKLINLVQQANDSRAYISSQIDPADLFEFFFEAGFIYPHKYSQIASKREEIINSYMALYQKGSDISRHFTYQSQGEIIGHFSTLRVYQQTWMNQHHAALNSQHAGLRVVRAISEYVNDCYLLDPTNTKYIIGYYQETNKFPRRYFGGYVQEVNDPKMTSLDCFSYINAARRFAGTPDKLINGWSLEPATSFDVIEFNGYYQTFHEGLLPEALDLTPARFADRTLEEAYKANGLVKKRELYALRYLDDPKALIDVQTSEFGLNLSEITNAMTVYLIDPSPDYFAIIRSALCKLALQQGKMSDPVMFFPNNYLSRCGVHADKEYTLWSLNATLTNKSYMSWMNRFCR